MPADEVAAIRPIVAEVLAAGPDWCATFTDERDESVWVQVSGDLINFSYTGNSDPEILLMDRAGPDFESVELKKWSKKGKFATFRIRELSVASATAVADAVFWHLLGREQGFPIGRRGSEADMNDAQHMGESIVSDDGRKKLKS